MAIYTYLLTITWKSRKATIFNRLIVLFCICNVCYRIFKNTFFSQVRFSIKLRRNVKIKTSQFYLFFYAQTHSSIECKYIFFLGLSIQRCNDLLHVGGAALLWNIIPVLDYHQRFEGNFSAALQCHGSRFNSRH